MFLMNITRGAAAGWGCGGGWGRAGGETEAAGAGAGGPAWGMGLSEGRARSEVGSSAAAGGGQPPPPPNPTPSLCSLLGVTKVQENYANEDHGLSQRGSLAGFYFLGSRLRNRVTLGPRHFQLRGEQNRNQREFPRLWAVALTCHPQSKNHKANLGGARIGPPFSGDLPKSRQGCLRLCF